MKFIDEVTIAVSSGQGGDGCISFRREKHVPFGGPDGGDGGRGGHLIFESTRQRNTLVDFRRNKMYKASRGSHGEGRRMYGAFGEDLRLMVPVGTVIYDAETDEPLSDLSDEGDTWKIPGGLGGKGNVHFKTSTRRTPRMATDGKLGLELKIRMELKLLADVGMLGFPNAGKSTLISKISAARPRVADYPFTTLVPSLGVVEISPGNSFVVADIPGLIEGASDGVGLGHKFLRHVERCECFVHLLSCDPTEELSPVERFLAINRELKRYERELAERPQFVVLNKIDLIDEETREELMAELTKASGSPVWAISAITTEGVRPLVFALWEHVQQTLATPDDTEVIW
ncbi:MAG: GTPase ObgE [Rhodobacterales bacterium]|nr:GTPase ObgE [Rhodobacterales bacterium]